MKEKNLFLKNTQLSGYKSIKSVDVDFVPGLNIIIGKNASGKTNFLTFLSRSLELKYDEFSKFSSRLSFINGKTCTIESYNSVHEKDNIFHSEGVKTIVSINDSVIEDNENNNGDIQSKLMDNEIRYSSTLICHGIPEIYHFVKSPFSYTVDEDGWPSDLSKPILDVKTPFFIRSILMAFFFGSIGNRKDKPFKEKIIKENLKGGFEKVDLIKEVLAKYTPIEDVRINKNFNIFINEDGKKYSVNNLFIEFKIEGNWHPFSNLSDGTKRLFYIVSETSFSDRIFNSKSGFGITSDKIPRIILIEEPELGVHPHQMMKLMEYLKDVSKKSQVILTTHSPQVLDVLNENELERIIIAFSKGDQEGTALRHLDQDEKSKALKYIKDDFLSDYWIYSNLEK